MIPGMPYMPGSTVERLRNQIDVYRKQYQEQMRMGAPEVNALTREIIAVQEAYIKELETLLAKQIEPLDTSIHWSYLKR